MPACVRYASRGMSVAVRLRFGLTKPKQPILGFDVAGRIEAIGSGGLALPGG